MKRYEDWGRALNSNKYYIEAPVKSSQKNNNHHTLVTSNANKSRNQMTNFQLNRLRGALKKLTKFREKS